MTRPVYMNDGKSGCKFGILGCFLRECSKLFTQPCTLVAMATSFSLAMVQDIHAVRCPVKAFPFLSPEQCRATICFYAKLLNTGHATDEYLPVLCRLLQGLGVRMGGTCTARADLGAACGCLHAHRAPAICPKCGQGHDCSPHPAAHEIWDHGRALAASFEDCRC